MRPPWARRQLPGTRDQGTRSHTRSPTRQPRTGSSEPRALRHDGRGAEKWELRRRDTYTRARLCPAQPSPQKMGTGPAWLRGVPTARRRARHQPQWQEGAHPPTQASLPEELPPPPPVPSPGLQSQTWFQKPEDQRQHAPEAHSAEEQINTGTHHPRRRPSPMGVTTHPQPEEKKPK